MEQAAWVPGWYELDQPLEVGRTDTFFFWRVVPEYLHRPERLVFYNTVWAPQDALMARGTITRILNPELGEIRKVDTRGLDYTFTLADGQQLTVNAEEEPGQVYELVADQWKRAHPTVANWCCIVEFESLSESELASYREWRRGPRNRPG